jgi:hypothetical protein
VKVLRTLPFAPLTEQNLDTLPWRAAEALGRVGRATRRRTSELRRRATVARRLLDAATRAPLSRHPLAREMVALDAARRRAPNPTAARWQLEALRIALEAGAYAMALDLANEALTRLSELEPALSRRALVLVLEALLAHGERDRAASVAAAHRHELERSARGVSALVMLGDEAAAGRLVLPDGRLNALGLSQQLAAGRLDGEELMRTLLGHPAALLRNPELHLLLHTAWRHVDPRRATMALNRFLRAHALGRCIVSEPWSERLRDLRFCVAAGSTRGPFVSVIIAAHDAEPTIEYAIESILRQTHRELELLVGDDGSRDGTLELVRRRYASEPRVRIFSSVANQGPYNVRNQLIAEARGELVTCHDADDLALPTRIEAQVRRMRMGALACYGCFVRVTPDGRFAFFRDQSAVRLCMVSLMTRKSVLDRVGFFRPAWFGADHELYQMLRHHYGQARIQVVRQPLVVGLWSAGSATRRPGAESSEDGFRSAARRIYAERVFERVLHPGAAADAAIDRAMRETGNQAEPARVVEDASRRRAGR